MPTAFSATELFDAWVVVTVHLVNDETFLWLSSDFSAANSNTGTMYGAKAP